MIAHQRNPGRIKGSTHADVCWQAGYREGLRDGRLETVDLCQRSDAAISDAIRWAWFGAGVVGTLLWIGFVQLVGFLARLVF